MTNTDDFFGLSPMAARCVAACDQYLGAARMLMEGFGNPGSCSAEAGLAVDFLAPWKVFAQHLGIRSDGTGGFIPSEPAWFGAISPALGLSREHQQIAQRMLELATQFGSRYSELLQQSSNVIRQAFQSTHEDPSDLPVQDSSRHAYDAWVDRAEHAYAQLAHSEGYARLLGELCNILSAFKIERAKMIEYFAKQFDLPTRAELDDLHREVRALRSSERERASNPSRVQKSATAQKRGAAQKTAKAGKRSAR